MKTRIHALLQLRSPLHIAHPNNARMSDAGQMVYGDQGFPCTAIQKLRVSNGDSMHDLPVIAGNNIAGRLRRHAATLVLNALLEKGQKVTLQTYGVLMCGAATGNPDTEDMTYAEYVESKNNVYFGLFGGGPKMFERKVRVHNALPVTAKTIHLRGDLSHPGAQEHIVPEGRMTGVWGFRRVDDLRDLSNIALAEGSVEKFQEEFEKRQGEILANKKDKEAGDESSSKFSTKTYSALEFVVPGVTFDHLFELDIATDAQLGLFLLSLDSLCATERLGGYVRNGFGAFTLENVLLVNGDGKNVEIFQNGRLKLNEPVVEAALQAWDYEAAQLDAKKIDDLVAISEAAIKAREKKEQAKLEKKAKAQKEKLAAAAAE